MRGSVVTQIIGGLGNQMFQYAAGRALSERLNCGLLLDCTGFDWYDTHPYFLNQLSIKAEQASISYLKLYGVPQFSSFPIIGKRIEKFLRNKSGACYVEKSFSYDPALLNLKKPVYIQGYWQSPKYFEDISHIIKNDFSFINEDHLLQPMKTRIADTLSVSMHVRRGDYITNKKAFSTHGICSLNYYKRAVDFFMDRYAEATFFVFSDDIDWIDKQFGSDNRFVIVGKEVATSTVQDLELMSLCKHHIVANSTFSWWGAWLSGIEGETIAPAKWFKDGASADDLIPKEWIRL